MGKNVKGSMLVFASALCWSFSGVLSKNLDWSGFSKTGVRAIVAVLIYAAARGGFKLKITLPTIVGGLGVVTTSALYMLALTYTTSANAIVLQYSMPVYVLLADRIIFKKKPSIKQIVLLPPVLLGVILCCAGKNAGAGELPHQMLGNILALVSGFTFSLVFLAGRMKGADSVDYTYFGQCLSLLLIVSALFDKNVRFGFEWDILSDWLLVGVMGLSLGIGYLLLAYGLRSASPVTAAILENLEPVLNPVWVFLFVGERPDTQGIIGCLIVLASVTVYFCLPDKPAGQNQTRPENETDENNKEAVFCAGGEEIENN